MPASGPATIRVEGIADTLRMLDNQLGDNGALYRKTVREIKKAGGDAVNRAKGFLPADEQMPSGFTYRNNNGWAQGRTEGRRPFPRYEKRSAEGSLRVISAREKSVRTAAGWRGGKMFGIAVEMRDPAGSIFDVAGNGRSRRQLNRRMSDPRSMRFIRLMQAASALPPAARFKVLLPAVIDTRPEIERQIRRILANAAAKIPDVTFDPWSIR